jgi:hypothetical protein
VAYVDRRDKIDHHVKKENQKRYEEKVVTYQHHLCKVTHQEQYADLAAPTLQPLKDTSDPFPTSGFVSIRLKMEMPLEAREEVGSQAPKLEDHFELGYSVSLPPFAREI